MSGNDLTPFPSALVLDTSFLRTLGGTRTAKYQTFIEYVKQEDVRLFLTQRVLTELDEQQAYMSIDWVDKAQTAEWIEKTGELQPGVRVHDGPRAGELFDSAHTKIAEREQENPDELRKTDASLPAISIMLLGSRNFDRIGILFDDRHAEDSIESALRNTYYDGRISVLNIWDVLSYMETEI
ncbi:hypothetical protein GS429_02695 [Natronorubrum sp. JWXQ-INN-674]|uniref:DUF4935 domain-containing protein n=1 Tax=Natronorubrum halalkaliphilum TaxID=2691917 RepID=A0A6B0VI79_9EURY|nr:hypothetical protein [Natronorubrum halalkaliphilum]MXV60983.1 hypothetical protein [Natronorubrum halalkaliphilum]